MNSNRLNHTHVYIIGLVLMLIVGGGMYFFMLKPINEANNLLRQQISATESEQVSVNNRNFAWNQETLAKQALQDAIAKRKSMQAELDAELASRSLPPSQALDLGDRSEQYVLTRSMPNWVLLPRRVVTVMRDYVLRSAKRHGIQVTGQFAAPAPSLDPKTVGSIDLIHWDLGSMTATGDFNRVMAWVKSFNNAPLLCSVDNLKCSLAGRNGKITATCSLTAFVFPKGVEPTGTPVGTGSGSTGMMPGGMGGMNGPGMMPGGGMNGPR